MPTIRTINTYCIPRKYNVPLIITNLTSALNSLKFLVVNVLRYAHAHVKHVKNRYHKGLIISLNITDAILSGFTVSQYFFRYSGD